MNYRQIKPSAAAARFVEFYWVLEVPAGEGFVQRIVPDGRAGIVLNFKNPFERQSGEKWERQPECFFIGQITAPLVLRPAGAAAMLGVQFRPEGAARFFGVPMNELNDAAVPLEALSRRLFRPLERARDCASPSQAVAAIDAVLARSAELGIPSDAPLRYAVAELDRSVGRMGVRQVADQIGWSTRQLQRRFNEAVGISPKMFARMQRFQALFRATEGQANDWVSAAVDCGYFDQSHLIRDFREFAGKTPSALLEQEIDLTRHFVRAKEMSHFYKTASGVAR
jgi:AraC-like DNA-binding protein